MDNKITSMIGELTDAQAQRLALALTYQTGSNGSMPSDQLIGMVEYTLRGAKGLQRLSDTLEGVSVGDGSPLTKELWEVLPVGTLVHSPDEKSDELPRIIGHDRKFWTCMPNGEGLIATSFICWTIDEMLDTSLPDGFPEGWVVCETLEAEDMATGDFPGRFDPNP